MIIFIFQIKRPFYFPNVCAVDAKWLLQRTCQESYLSINDIKTISYFDMGRLAERKVKKKHVSNVSKYDTWNVLLGRMLQGFGDV